MNRTTYPIYTCWDKHPEQVGEVEASWCGEGLPMKAWLEKAPMKARPEKAGDEGLAGEGSNEGPTGEG